ncbi:MAG: FHA domain-containing protein [Elusimicrobia bacterium]|jgi:pSer/pThr/pTyr-binding forkhead associated (FHA) protein|nr:FHA domain-containing protein [Elusimicrobiota bacterium]
MAKLVFGYPFMQKEYLLREKDEFYIGRMNSNDITIPDYNLFSRLSLAFQKEMVKELMKVSRIHARIIKQEGEWYIEDVGTTGEGSNYGTFINDEQIETKNLYPLKDNDKIRLGPLECAFFLEQE